MDEREDNGGAENSNGNSLPPIPPGPRLETPLAFTEAGKRVQLPAEARLWLVYYQRAGAPCAVQRQSGGPLFLPLNATHEELRAAAGPGRFKLTACDVDGEHLPAPMPSAFCELAAPAEGPKPDRAVEELTKLVTRLVESNEKIIGELRGALTEASKATGTVAKALADAHGELAKAVRGEPVRVAVHEKPKEEPEEKEPTAADKFLDLVSPIVSAAAPDLMQLGLKWLRGHVGDAPATGVPQLPAAGGSK